MRPYSERVRWPFYFHVLMGSVVLFCLSLATRGIFAGRSPVAFGLLMLVALILGGVWWGFRHLNVEIGPGGLAFGFGGLRRRVSQEQLRSVEVEDYRFARYLGYGYRIGWGTRDRAYSVMGHRRGLRIRFEDGRRREWSVFLSLQDPEAARAACQQ